MRLIFGSAALRRFAILPVAVILLSVRVGFAADVVSRVSPGGIGRYTSGHWGLVRGSFSNSTDQDQTVTAIVTPRGSSGARFARSIVVPRQTNRDAAWPVLLADAHPDVFEFDVLVVKGEQDSRQISELNGDLTDSFLSSNAGKPATGTKPTGFCGLLSSRTESLRDESIIGFLMQRLRRHADKQPMAVFIEPDDIRGYAEALEPLDQLVISSPDLPKFPETCDAVRLWIQRGGRALLLLDQCGEDSAAAILGDALPLSIVDRTSALRVPLKEEVPVTGVGDASHLREFDEPVTIVRAVFEAGNVQWSVRGWPVLVEVPFGDGVVLVSAISPEVFLSAQGDAELDSLAEPILEFMFRTPPDKPVLSDEQLATASQRRIGYAIPGRGSAAVVLVLFTVLLGVAGWFARRREQPGVWLLAVSLLSLAAAVPGIVSGRLSRGVAPATLIETRVAHLIPGQAHIAADGVSTIYQPTTGTSELQLSEHALLSRRQTNGVPQQRLVWNDTGMARWVGFSQPVGATSYHERSVVRLPEPLHARAEFHEDGIQIAVTNTDVLDPDDILLVGHGSDHMAPQARGDGLFFVGPADVLVRGQVSTESLLSESQLLHSDLYKAVFNGEERFRRFPPLPSLMFWTKHLPGGVQTSDEAVRHESMSLVSLPLELGAPPVNKPISIPTVLMRRRAIRMADGSISAAYSNRHAQWMPRKRGTKTLLQFEIPSSCRPFHFDGADLQLRILAGSRAVRLHSGPRDNLVEVQTLQSPVGNVNMSIPGSVLNTDSDHSRVFLRVEVGDLPGAATDGSVNVEQDDFWKIERVLMTVRGHRMSQQPSSQETTTSDE